MLENEIVQFFKAHDLNGLLLGLSGGPDSMALFHLLRRLKAPFQAAHVDHGWREESSLEAAKLAEICQKTEVPFHLKRLEPPKGGNLEEKGRLARLAFFKEICSEEKLRGVALAHHADDQAETVLKRVFEGASLPKLKGLALESEVEGVTIYRPLLKIRKKEILAWLQQEKIPYFSDSTNEDSRFLRTRLREDLLPTLSKSFGKEITPSLCRLGEAAAELQDYLETLIAPYRNQECLNFHELPSHPYVQKMIIRDYFASKRIALSVSVLDTIFFHLRGNRPSIKIQVGKYRVEIHNKRIKLHEA